MKTTIVGIENVNYTSRKTNQQVTGVRLFFEREPTSRESTIEGMVTGSEFISSNSDCFKKLPEMVFGGVYDFIYDSDGRFTFLSEVRAVEA